MTSQHYVSSRCVPRALRSAVLGCDQLHLDRVAIEVILLHHDGRRIERTNRAVLEHQQPVAMVQRRQSVSDITTVTDPLS